MNYSDKEVNMFLDGNHLSFDYIYVDTNWNQLAGLDDWIWGAALNLTKPGCFEGKYDEIRVSNITRSADWIKTKYNNQNDPSAFYSISDEKRIYHPSPDDFEHFKEITIDHNKVSGSSDLINFPLLISICDTDLRNDVQSDGEDIAFYNGSEWLDHEIELFNQTYNVIHV
jgi:hypothetical protein